MTANFDTKHLLKKLRSLFRKLYSTCFVFAATDCFDRYTWCHLVPQHKVCDHEFYGTHCCLSCKGHRWCLIWYVQQQPYNFYCDKKTFMCSSSPSQSLGGSMEKASGNMSQVFCPPQPDKLSATLLVLWFAFCWSRSYTMSPTQFLTLFSRKAMNASFWYCRRCVTAIGSWSMNSEREMVTWFFVCLQQAKLFLGVMLSFHKCSLCANLTLYAKTSPSSCLTVIPFTIYKVFNYIQIYRVYFS